MNAGLFTARLTRVDSRLVLDGPEQSSTVAARIPGATWARSRRSWTYPATPGLAARIVDELKADGWRLTGDQAAHELRLAWDRTLSAAEHRTRDELPDVPSGSPFPAWLHQRRAFWFARELVSPILEYGVGTGKSRVAVDLADDWHVMTALVLCPRKVIGVWPREILKHSARRDEWIVAARVPRKRGAGYIDKPSVAQRVELFADALEQGRLLHRPVILVCNYEAAWRDALASWILDRQWDLGVLDECHRIKAAGGAASRFTNRLRDRCTRRLELSGTLMPHSGLDVYSPCRFAEPALFGLNAAAFRAEFGEQKILANGLPLVDGKGQPVMEGIKPEKRAELARRLATITVQARSEDVLDLPELLLDDREVELGPDARRAYDELEAELVAEVDRGIVTADNALTKLIRLAQATSGYLPVEETCARCLGSGRAEDFHTSTVEGAAAAEAFLGGHGRPRCGGCKGKGVTSRVVTIGTEKADTLAEYLDDVPGRRVALDGTQLGPEPVIVFARFRHDLDAIRGVVEAKGLRYGELSGNADTVLDEHAVMRQDVDVAAVQWRAGGVGVDLTRARLGVSYSVGYELELWIQGIGRYQRPSEHVDARRDQSGSHASLHLTRFIVPNSADEDVYNALEQREEAVDAVLNRLRARIAELGQVAA